MNPNQLFNPVSVTIPDYDPSHVVKSGAPLGRVFTFLNFEVVEQGGKFYVKVIPYPQYTGFYRLLSDQQPEVTMYSDGQSPLFLPIIVTSGNTWEKDYQVLFSPDKPFGSSADIYVYSQVLHYKADNNKLSLAAPDNFKILRDYALTPDPAAANNDLAWLTFTAQWDIGDWNTIKDLAAKSYPNPLEIEYKMNQSVSPEDNAPKEFDIVKLSLTSPDGLATSPGGLRLNAEYSDNRGYAVSAGPVQLGFRTDAGEGGAEYTYYAVASFRAPVALTGAAPPSKALEDIMLLYPNMDNMLTYPNIYFLNIENYSVNVTDVKVEVSASMFDSITLNKLSDQELPPPQSFTAGSPVTTSVPEETSFLASFILPGEGIMDYVSGQALHPVVDATADLYISQDEGYMSKQFMPLDYAGRVKPETSVEAPYDPAYGRTLYFSAINGQNPMAAPGFADAREALRAGRVIRVTGVKLTPDELVRLINKRDPINITLKLDGMDKNQKYFLCADIVLTAGAFGEQRQSRKTSSLAGVTTIGEMEKPDPSESEQIPPSPEELTVKEVQLSFATLTWKAIYPITKVKGERIEYEIIRLKDEPMDPAMLDWRLPFERFYADGLPTGAEKAGWRTNLLVETDAQGNIVKREVVIEGYDGAAYAVLDETKAVYNPYVNPIEFTDKTLVPNQIYYYYVRTARVIGDTRVASVWSRVNVTSKPVASPKNLRTEQGAEYNYIRTTETVFSFDAPFTDVKAQLGKDYNLQYQLQENGDVWQEPVTMNPADLAVSESTEQGFSHFIYKLTGLNPGSLYAIRVRMVDQNGDGSIYTNVIQVKTDIDQGEYDNSHKASEWVEYIKKALNDLLKAPYWTTRDSGGAFEAVYRPDMFEGLIRAGAAPVLLAESGAAQTAYYLPASAVNAANAAGKGIRIPHGDMEVLLSPNALDGNYNDAIRSAMDKVKTGHAEDYYIKIVVVWTSPRTNAGTENRRADVAITAVGSLTDISKWNGEVMNKLAEQVSGEVSDPNLINNINAGVERGYRPERMAGLMDQVRTAANRELGNIADRDLRPSLRYAFPLTRVDEPIIVISKNLDPRRDVHAYRYDGSAWAPLSVKDFGGDRAVIEDRPGAYVFSGVTADMPSVRGTASAGSKNAMAAKYHLEDFFSSNTGKAASRFAVAGAAARIAGAPKDAEPYAWLRGHMKLPLSAYGPANPATQQEIVYILMNLYAYKTRTDLNSLVKRDFAAQGQSAGVKDEYLPAVRAAYSAGLLKPGEFAANGTFSEAAVMDMLRRLDEMIGF